MATVVAAVAKSPAPPRSSSARPRPTRARFCTTARVAAVTLTAALAAASAAVKRAMAVSVICARVSGCPKTSEPSGFAVLKGTPEHQFSANQR